LKVKTNIILCILIVVLISIIILADNTTLNSLYFKNEDIFTINQINTGKRNDSIVYNEVNVTRVSMINNNDNNANSNNSNNSNIWTWPTTNNYHLTGNYSYYHKALDIAGVNGSDIYAANSGVVVTVKAGCRVGNLSCNGRGGNYIIIKHHTNNYYSVYMHLKDIKVSLGQSVSSGQVIGTMGNTGNVRPVPINSNSTSGTHLHFCLYIGEPYRGGYAINPMSMY